MCRLRLRRSGAQAFAYGECGVCADTVLPMCAEARKEVWYSRESEAAEAEEEKTMSTRVNIVRRLQRLAPSMTQAEAARRMGIYRQQVHKLAQDYGIKFFRQRMAPKPRLCTKCAYRLNRRGVCLRCKWTPQRVKQLREHYDMSQIEMSLNVLGMHVWAFTRWESGRVQPSRRALVALEKAERRLKD